MSVCEKLTDWWGELYVMVSDKLCRNGEDLSFICIVIKAPQ